MPGPPVKKRRRDDNNVNIPAAAVIEDVKEVCISISSVKNNNLLDICEDSFAEIRDENLNT